MADVTRLRRGGMGWYEGELSPLAVIDREFAKLDEIRNALAEDPSDERLQELYTLKRRQLRELTGQTLAALNERQRDIGAKLARLAAQYPELLDE